MSNEKRNIEDLLSPDAREAFRRAEENRLDARDLEEDRIKKLEERTGPHVVGDLLSFPFHPTATYWLILKVSEDDPNYYVVVATDTFEIHTEYDVYIPRSSGWGNRYIRCLTGCYLTIEECSKGERVGWIDSEYLIQADETLDHIYSASLFLDDMEEGPLTKMDKEHAMFTLERANDMSKLLRYFSKQRKDPIFQAILSVVFAIIDMVNYALAPITSRRLNPLPSFIGPPRPPHMSEIGRKLLL